MIINLLKFRKNANVLLLIRSVGKIIFLLINTEIMNV